MLTRPRRLGAVLAGLTAAGALFAGGAAVASAATGSPAVAGSDTSSDVVDAAFDTGTDTGTRPRCTAVQRWTTLADEAPQVRDLLTAHPDVAGELDHVRSLPRGQRRAELRDWVRAHPDQHDVIEQLRDIRTHARESCTTS